VLFGYYCLNRAGKFYKLSVRNRSVVYAFSTRSPSPVEGSLNAQRRPPRPLGEDQAGGASA